MFYHIMWIWNRTLSKHQSIINLWLMHFTATTLNQVMHQSSPSLKHNILEREIEIKRRALINVPYKPYSAEMRSRANLISNTLPHPLPVLTPSPLLSYSFQMLRLQSHISGNFKCHSSGVILRVGVGDTTPPLILPPPIPTWKLSSSPPQRWDNIWAPMRISL